MNLEFTVEGDPFGKPAVSRDRQGNRYRPASVTRFYRHVSWVVAAAAKRCAASLPMSAPIITITAVKKRPQKRPKDYPLPWTRARNPCLAKPDADNVAKAMLDALTRCGVYADDQRVSALTVITWYAAADEGPHTHVVVRDMAQ